MDSHKSRVAGQERAKGMVICSPQVVPSLRESCLPKRIKKNPPKTLKAKLAGVYKT